jgi:outer membrane cobalamin receptor
MKVSARKQWLLLAGLALVAPLHAADDLFELPLESLMEVRVSVASPFAESVMDAASSVYVLQPADWQRRGARSLEEALEQVPSVVPYASLGGASMYAIRGYANEISVRGTAMQLDGVPLNSFSYSTAAYSLPYVPLPFFERIEMIRGTGSALYGTDAFHGVVALNTWQPKANQRALHVAAGTAAHNQQAVVFSGIPGGVRISGGIASTHNGDAGIGYRYIDPISAAPGTGTWDTTEQDDAAFLDLAAGNEQDGLWRAGVFADAWEGEDFPGTGTQFHRPILALVQAASADLLRDGNDMGQQSSFWMARASYQRALRESLDLELRSYAWQNDQQWILDATRYPGDGELLANDGTALACRRSPTETGVSPLYCPHTQRQDTAERRIGVQGLLRREGGGNTQWALGAGRDWFDVLAASVQRVSPTGTPYYDNPTPFEGVERTINHLYAQARTDTGHWSWVYGARWDSYSDIDDSEVSPRLAAIYRGPGAAWNAKLLYGHAFRAPSAAEQYGAGGGTQQLAGQNLKPEVLDTLELVWQLRRDDADTELVLFASSWQDGIVLVPVAPGVGQYVNTGENSAHGIEFLHRRSLGNWRLEGNASWVFSHNDASGTEYTGFPAWLLNLSLGRSLAGGWLLALNERVMLDVAEGDTLGAWVPPKAPHYYRTDLHLGWQQDNVGVAFDVRNLFDRDNIAPSMFNASGGTPEAGVEVTMSVEVRL